MPDPIVIEKALSGGPQTFKFRPMNREEAVRVSAVMAATASRREALQTALATVRAKPIAEQNDDEVISFEARLSEVELKMADRFKSLFSFAITPTQEEIVRMLSRQMSDPDREAILSVVNDFISASFPSEGDVKK